MSSSYSDYLPINTSSTFDNTQNSYTVSKILTPEYTFDLEKYKNYSPMFLAPTFLLNYGLSFAALTAAIVHTIIFNGKEVWYRYKAARNQEPDIHMKVMAKYDEAPDWWYGVLFVISMAMGLATCLGFDSQLPCKHSWSDHLEPLSNFIEGWAFFVSNIIGLVFIVSIPVLCFEYNHSFLSDSHLYDPGNYQHHAL